MAHSYGRSVLQPGDEIVLTELEHHANHLPWLMLARERGLAVKFIHRRRPARPGRARPADPPRTRLVSFAHVSNVLGTIT